MKHALEIKALSKVYKNSEFKLDKVNLAVEKGTVMGLVGKNGAGKSTIINSIFEIVKKDEGEILVDGREINKENKKFKNEIGVVFDTLAYSGDMNCMKLEKVLDGLYCKFDKEQFNFYLEKFELPKDQKFKTFSRGMTMKLSISVALSHGAKLLILDEATAGLDPVIREEILDIFIDFVSNEENSILMSSHITSDLERIADYITFIDNGKIILVESKDKLIYEYGIARLREKEFDKVLEGEYIGFRKRGFQYEVLVKDKKVWSRQYPDTVIDSVKIDEILPILLKGEQ